MIPADGSCTSVCVCVFLLLLFCSHLRVMFEWDAASAMGCSKNENAHWWRLLGLFSAGVANGVNKRVFLGTCDVHSPQQTVWGQTSDM